MLNMWAIRKSPAEGTHNRMEARRHWDSGILASAWESPRSVVSKSGESALHQSGQGVVPVVCSTWSSSQDSPPSVLYSSLTFELPHLASRTTGKRVHSPHPLIPLLLLLRGIPNAFSSSHAWDCHTRTILFQYRDDARNPLPPGSFLRLNKWDLTLCPH